MRAMRAGLTPRELEVTAAWWHTGTVKEAGQLLNLSEQTAKNTLYTARLRSGAPTNLALALMFRERIEELDVPVESARPSRWLLIPPLDQQVGDAVVALRKSIRPLPADPASHLAPRLCVIRSPRGGDEAGRPDHQVALGVGHRGKAAVVHGGIL